jgi:hypothetical protein
MAKITVHNGPSNADLTPEAVELAAAEAVETERNPVLEERAPSADPVAEPVTAPEPQTVAPGRARVTHPDAQDMPAPAPQEPGRATRGAPSSEAVHEPLPPQEPVYDWPKPSAPKPEWIDALRNAGVSTVWLDADGDDGKPYTKADLQFVAEHLSNGRLRIDADGVPQAVDHAEGE